MIFTTWTNGGREEEACAQVAEEGGPVPRGVKGKNFCKDEEEQLRRNVLHVIQDRIVGNQQRAGVFWDWITTHYHENQPQGPPPQRSLETKWGTIKHDVSKFIGVYSQVMWLNRSGTSTINTLRRAHDLYKQKNEKGSDFAFEHCWVLLRDHPKWAEGWTQVKVVTPKRKVPCSEEESDCIDLTEMERGVWVDLEGGGGSAEGGSIAAEATRIFKGRPGGAKLAKKKQRQGKIREGMLFAHAEATKSMVAAHMRKVALLEDQNLLMLMSMPDADSDAKEYLRL